MIKEKQFINELADLMQKHKVIMYIDVEQDYSGVQDVELRFDTENSSGTMIFGGLNKEFGADEIRRTKC